MAGLNWPELSGSLTDHLFSPRNLLLLWLVYPLVKIFHEFGHALHSVLTQTRYASFSGTSVPRDFVEAPSQMLENWIWDKSVLDRFAVDYRDPNKKIPADTLDKMEQARQATIGTWYRRQLSFGMLDLKLHLSTDEKDRIDLSNI